MVVGENESQVTREKSDWLERKYNKAMEIWTRKKGWGRRLSPKPCSFTYLNTEQVLRCRLFTLNLRLEKTQGNTGTRRSRTIHVGRESGQMCSLYCFVLSEAFAPQRNAHKYVLEMIDHPDKKIKKSLSSIKCALLKILLLYCQSFSHHFRKFIRKAPLE